MSGTLPTRSYNEGLFESGEPISGKVMYDSVLKERDTSCTCIERCKRVAEIEDGPCYVNRCTADRNTRPCQHSARSVR